jgi:hypothetical protein
MTDQPLDDREDAEADLPVEEEDEGEQEADE